MRAHAIERQKERETALAARQKELEELRQRKAQLGEELGMELSGLDNDNLEAAFPVVQYCGSRPKKDAKKIPVENLGSIMNQFDIAIRAITQNNRTLEQQVHDLNRDINLEAQRFMKLKQHSKELADTTGVCLDPTAVQHLVGRSRDGDENAVILSDLEETKGALEEQKALVEKEIRAARQLVKKKEDAVVAMSEALRTRQEEIDQLNALFNDIRVIDRDIRCEKETLQEIINEHDIVDAKLNEAIERNVSRTRLLIEQGIQEIKTEITDSVSVSRRGQERVMKAQEFRIDQLEKRLDCIQKALKNNHLTRDVEAMLSHRWSTAGEALVSTTPDESMYDIEAIIPPQERCHPAIYNLLLTEKERLARRISLLGIIAKEKREVIDALACKAEALARECQQAIQELDHVASAAAYDEDMQREEAVEHIQKLRAQYTQLFKKWWTLKTNNKGPTWRTY